MRLLNLFELFLLWCSYAFCDNVGRTFLNTLSWRQTVTSTEYIDSNTVDVILKLSLVKNPSISKTDVQPLSLSKRHIGISFSTTTWQYSITSMTVIGPHTLEIRIRFTQYWNSGIIYPNSKFPNTGTGRNKDCAAILKWNAWTKGKDRVYTIYPDGNTPKKVFCDMTTDGGGWTVLQKRNDGSTDFNQNWKAYKEGFGNPENEYWIGNDVIHQLTKNGDQILRIDIEDFKGRGGFATYSTFSILNESQKYKLHIGGYSGTIGDSMWKTKGWNTDLDGRVFATVDNDNGSIKKNCARTVGGGSGWWYNWCTYANLNAAYHLQPINNRVKNIYWYSLSGYNTVKKAKMMIRKKN